MQSCQMAAYQKNKAKQNSCQFSGQWPQSPKKFELWLLTREFLKKWWWWLLTHVQEVVAKRELNILT